MQIDAKFLVEHLAYSRWASERSVDSVRPLTVEEQNRYMYVSHHGVLKTLEHIYQADKIWLSRLIGQPFFKLADAGEGYTLHSLAEAWAKVADDYAAWAAGLSDEAINGTLKYVNIQGKAFELPIWQVLLHVVNHASYHRGQITSMLRQLNHNPIVTDLAAYYNRHATAAVTTDR